MNVNGEVDNGGSESWSVSESEKRHGVEYEQSECDVGGDVRDGSTSPHSHKTQPETPVERA
jgi:hypothetical protein